MCVFLDFHVAVNVTHVMYEGNIYLCIFRFPCCGKCYPCDVCHDDNEGDHQMKYANRMICGFCCKEQVKQTKPPIPSK